MTATNRRPEERDPAVRRAHLGELARIAASPARARAFLIRAALIQPVRKARTID